MKRENPFLIRDTLATIKGFRRLREEGSHFWFGQTQEKINLSVSRQKFRLVLFILIITLILILSRIFWLQVIKGENYNLIAEGNRIRLENIKAERGIIYDRFNTPLVANIPSYSLYFIPADLPQTDQQKNQIASKLSGIIQLTQQEIVDLFDQTERSYRPQLIINQLSHRQAVSLSVIEFGLSGIKLAIEPRRHYLENSGLAHVLGYVGKINPAELKELSRENYNIGSYLGKNGIELAYESVLRGINGKQEIEVDATGKTKKILNKIEPKIGKSVILTIDLDLQKKLTEKLSQAIKNSSTSRAGAAIALDPNSGQILALVSLPDFDNNFFSAGIDRSAYQKYLADPAKPLFNRVISGTYPPGSIFKPIIALAALEEGIIDQRKTFLSTGGLRINQWFFPDWKYGGHGRINVVTAIAESVNTFFYYIGGGYDNFSGLGVDKITAFARQFNL